MVKRKIVFATKFKKDIKRLKRRSISLDALNELIFRLELKSLKSNDADHALKGDFLGYRECHIKGDWILVYRELDENTVELYRTGTHQDIFKKIY